MGMKKLGKRIVIPYTQNRRVRDFGKIPPFLRVSKVFIIPERLLLWLNADC
jgi:hypothetical protein